MWANTVRLLNLNTPNASLSAGAFPHVPSLRTKGKLDPIVDSNLVVDVVQIVFDNLVADSELLSDFAVLQSLALSFAGVAECEMSFASEKIEQRAYFCH